MHLSFEVFWWLISSNGCYFCARQRHLFRLPQHSQWQHGLFLPTRLRFQAFSGCFFRFHLQILPLHSGSRYLQAQGFLQHWEDFPAGTAIELSANGKTINLLVTAFVQAQATPTTQARQTISSIYRNQRSRLLPMNLSENCRWLSRHPLPYFKKHRIHIHHNPGMVSSGQILQHALSFEKNRIVARWRNNIFRNVSCCLC